MSTYTEQKPKVTTQRLREMKARGEKIACLTSYDYTTAKLVDEAGMDLILVGDSASNVMLGNETTVSVTLDDMIVFAKGVVKGVKRAFTVVDLPFGTYQGDPKDAFANAVRVLRETGAEAVKLEGGEEIRQSIEWILRGGIPVVGHLGLTPQSINKFGSYGVRAKEEAEAEKLKRDARMLDELGCCAIVLEKVPSTLAKEITESVNVPVIGIGAGGDTDGQVLVFQDMMGMNEGFRPKFLRRYAELGQLIKESVGKYVDDVKSSDFPNETEQY